MDIVATNLNLYKYFLAVMEEQSVTRAAHKMGVSQPTVSYNIKELEKELGEKLFEPADGGIIPSDYAVVLYRSVKPLYMGMLDLEKTLKQGGSVKKQKSVRLGITAYEVNGGIIKFIHEFGKKYPHIDVSIINEPRPILWKMLSKDSGEIDLLLHAFTARAMEIHKEKNDVHRFEPIKRLGYSMVSKKGENASGLPFMCTRTSLNEEIYDARQLNRKELLPATSPETVIEFVRLGAAKSILLDDFIDRHNADNTLEKKKIAGPDYFLCLVCNYDRISLPAKLLHKELKEHFI